MTFGTDSGILDMVMVGKRIRLLRHEKGLTLPALAEKAGVSKGFLFQIEDDEKANPSLETLSKLADALDVTLAELLEKESVQAKRLIPENVEPGLKEFIAEQNAKGEPVEPSAIQALYALQHRKARPPKSKEDWRYLYETIERVFKGR